MFGLETLDVLIGLMTVYLALGMACTAIVEAVATWLSVRSTNLEAALTEFLAGDLNEAQTFVKAFYDHPLVQALSKGKDGRPSYIPPETVGQVVEALVTENGSVVSLAEAVNKLPRTPETNRIKGLLNAFVTQTSGDAAKFRKAVETHFDAVMDRASGWVKRRQQTVALVVSAVLVIGANVDTVALATSLASSPEARAKMVDIAEERLKQAKTVENTIEEQGKAGNAEDASTIKRAKQQSEEALKSLNQAKFDLQSAGFRIGWKGWPSPSEWLAKVAGLLVSIFAVSLGAPFWFDVLQRFMQVRAAGVSPRETKDEKK
jgi:hypothetical protein